MLLEEVRTVTKQLAVLFDGGGATKPDDDDDEEEEEEEEEAASGEKEKEKVGRGSDEEVWILPELQKAIKLGALMLQSELEKLRYAAFPSRSPFPFLSVPSLRLRANNTAPRLPNIDRRACSV
eukprot:COSAG06_NODE_9136_length_1977_cov_8.437167_1_plen_123_part_00